jgi:nucleoside-diphosphate-sugar epimerase
VTGKRILVTGASGLVGAEVVSRLVAQEIPVTGLVHRTARIVRNDGSVVPESDLLTVQTGDVCRPRFGWDRADAAELGTGIRAIVHLAATTAFDARPDEYRRLNVDAVQHVVDLALAWDVPLVHVSTAYVCGIRSGVVTEEELDVGQSFGTGYEQSKFRAEAVVRDAAARGLRAIVVRPGIVTGTTDDGAIRDYKNFYMVVKLIVEGKLRSLPGRYDATLSLAPVDHVADMVVAAALGVTDCGVTEQTGRTVHAVGADVLSLRDVSDVLAEYPSFEVARFVPPATFAAADLPGAERDYFDRIGSLYTSYFDRRPAFDVSGATELLGRPMPRTGTDYLRLLLDHCLESGYLGTPLPSIDEVLAAVRAG